MNEQRTLHPKRVTRATLVRPADPFARSSSDSLWKLPLQQQPALFQEGFPFLHLNSLKSPPWGIVKGKEKRRQGEEEEGGGQSIVEKTESLWMERMESLESVGLYLILVSRQPMSNGEKGTAAGDNPTHRLSEGGYHPGSTCWLMKSDPPTPPPAGADETQRRTKSTVCFLARLGAQMKCGAWRGETVTSSCHAALQKQRTDLRTEGLCDSDAVQTAPLCYG